MDSQDRERIEDKERDILAERTTKSSGWKIKNKKTLAARENCDGKRKIEMRGKGKGF